jgi:abnormal spindle-like microcephaly-associated protein
MRRVKRDEDIALGKSERVVITPKPKTEGRNRFHFFHYADESDIKDPIQRAGRRILSKSAIPIQCAARRYIAKREAVDRMWALIEIQSYYRRWRAEANLQASIHSAVQIQAAFRGWSARDKLKDMNNSATQIQKIVRGYLCQVKVYDSIYYIVRLQALVRGCVERASQQKKRLAATQLQKYLRGYKTRLDIFRGSRATPFQALYRGHKARQDFYIAVASAKLLQATWRSCAARISYQVEIVDIIITQSVARRWLACRYANSLRDLELFGPASIIQATWRGRVGRQLLKKNISAQKIQTIWRGFRCYTDYVFAMVDILVVQRTARVWLAKREAYKIRQANAAL